MTRAKLGIFIEPDGFDERDGTPIIRIYGEPEMRIDAVKNDGGSTDLRPRAMFRIWELRPGITIDSGIMGQDDALNLIVRAGIQVGLCAGRHDSSRSNGLGWGCFRVPDQKLGRKASA